MIEFHPPVALDPEILAYVIRQSSSHDEIMTLILALDNAVADLDFTKDLYEQLGIVLANEEEN